MSGANGVEVKLFMEFEMKNVFSLLTKHSKHFSQFDLSKVFFFFFFLQS